MNDRNCRLIPCISPKHLLWLAGIVWFIAGGNVFYIGIKAFMHSSHVNPLYLLGSFAVYFIFMRYIFYPLFIKHNKRIMNMNCQKTPFYSFFDKKSYIVMVSMMTFGIVFRNLALFPPTVIGFLYCGIGASLITAGILFVGKFFIRVE